MNEELDGYNAAGLPVTRIARAVGNLPEDSSTCRVAPRRARYFFVSPKK